ncbi:MAG: hypothetical protein JW925_07385 [Syntrophaceae bacterium]|nr:hypothetical protein [Syntrophaceae bacterium]
MKPTASVSFFLSICLLLGFAACKVSMEKRTEYGKKILEDKELFPTIHQKEIELISKYVGESMVSFQAKKDRYRHLYVNFITNDLPKIDNIIKKYGEPDRVKEDTVPLRQGIMIKAKFHFYGLLGFGATPSGNVFKYGVGWE